MRLTRIAAATLVAGSLTFAGTGIALADTVTPVTSTSAASAASAASAVAEPGDLMLSATSVQPGSRITFSGSVATPTTGTGAITVTSPAFAGPATMTRTDPTAFAGSATIASDVTAGTYTVTASSSAGTVTGRITVTGGAPAPVPAHHGTHTTGHHTSAATGSDAGTAASSTDLTDPAAPAGSDVLPWALGSAGVIALIGGGAYALGRGRRTDRDIEAARARQDYREPRTEVMTRR